MMALAGAPLRVVGRYAVYHEIAAGGMATVHIGRLLGPVGFARTVAIKRLHPQFAKDPEFVSMFLDEARLAARVQHPNVVATIDVVATDGELFLIMDYVRGESLSKLIRLAHKREEVVPPRVAAAIICGFLHGLHAAHEAKNERGEPLNLVHRDVSPQNVLVGSDGTARVLDFGIAKAQGRIQVTRDGQIKGKLAYMPPEQLSGRELSRAVDVYASAVVMWETLTAERLFKGETEGETLAKILRDPVPPPSAIVPSVPKSFDAVLLKALSREASRRHATAKELALEIERCVGVASPTEVGEWVDATAGSAITEREEQIAAIESSSAGLRVSPSGRPEPDSTSDVHGIEAAQAGTLLGIGPPSGTHGQRPESKIATAPLGIPVTPISTSQPDRASNAPTPHGTRGEGEGTPSNATKLTGTMALPVDRRLPVLAAAAGLFVLLGIMGFVIAGGASGEPKAETSASAGVATSAGNAATTSAIPSAVVGDGTKPAASASAAETAQTPGSTAAAAIGTPTTGTPTTARTGSAGGAATAKAASGGTTGPATTAKAAGTGTGAAGAASAAAKKPCDPFTIDPVTGRRKYNRDCI
jgi:serine/threonine-protein kinase